MDTAAREQAWNTEQLAHPVTRPSWRVWTYRSPALVLGCTEIPLALQASPELEGVALLDPAEVLARTSDPQAGPAIARMRQPEEQTDIEDSEP